MGRRQRSEKDPNQPKAPCSAQQFFNKARRAALKEEEPSLASVEVQTRLAEEWRALPAAGRAPYVKEALKDKTRFEGEMTTFEPNPAMLKATKGGNRLQKDPLRPKKPKSAYLYFGEATRAELTESNPGIRIETLSKLIGEEWKKLSDEAKAPYSALAETDQERYKREMEAYTPSAAYLAAKEAFKKKKAAGNSSAAADGEDEEDDDAKEEMKEENKELKKQVAALEKEKAKMQKQIDTLMAKAEKASEKAAAVKEKAAQKPPPKPPKEKAPKPAPAAKEKAEKPKEKAVAKAPSEDPAHYLQWTKKILGSKGEKADPEMLKIMASKGSKGLAALLVKKYKAEHK